MNGELPGRTSHETMMVKPRYKSIEKKTSIPAAVLILLYPIKNKWHFFLTKRTNTVEHHKGQISLPGGMLEKGESHKEAAIRETFEELGIQSEDINIIGPLTPLYIPISNFKIFPFVGWIKSNPKLNIQSKEVSKVFSPSIFSLMDPQTKKNKDSILLGQKVKIPFFNLKNEVVWGATSMIISEFKNILKGII
ncbi:MAG: NUDIX hydrolase [Candidatus Neomarinimicrobiota bacterium]